MSKNNNEVNVLDELNKGACMGMDAINFVLNKVKDKDLEKELRDEYQKYEAISNKIHELYPDYNNDCKPHETNAMNKAMTWYGIEMKTMMDDSTSKITELLLQGTNMGIIEGRKLLNNKEVNQDVHKIIQEYIDMQESSVEKLKKFL